MKVFIVIRNDKIDQVFFNVDLAIARVAAETRAYEFQHRIGDPHEQGFIDQHGVFMDRREAWQVATAANQIIQRVGGDDADGGTLYSENLY